MRKRLGIAVAAIAVVAAVGIGLYVWKGEQTCAPNRANAEAAPTTAGDPHGPSAVILGDSYSTGWGLSDPTDSYAYELAAIKKWDATVDGFPGTGYAVDGACGDRSFDTRTNFPESVEYIVIEGGINDAIFDPAGLEAAIDRTLKAALTTGAEVTVVGVPVVDGVDPHRAADVNEALSRAAKIGGATFVPLDDIPISTTDGTHADAASHALIAQRIASSVS